MDGPTFLDDLRNDHETPLSRLGSSKSIYALTGGEMDGDVLRSEITSELRALADVARGWTDEAEANAVTDLFGDVAAVATEHAEVLDAGGDAGGGAGGAGGAAGGGSSEDATAAADPDRSALTGSLSGHDGDVARAGALAGGLLVFGKLSEQLVGFFVGDADRKGADQFREFRSDVETLRDDAADSLESLCDDDEEWRTARTAADDVVETTYDWYVKTLESMGVEPKNVC